MARGRGGFIGQDGLNAPDSPTGVSGAKGDTQATISFTAPTDVGGSAITGYRAQSNDGIGASGSSSPITVTGLTNETSYTFKVWAINSFGYSAPSDASASVTPAAPLQIEYTTSGSYSWVAPTGVTSVSVVCVGGGGTGSANQSGASGGGGGGGLGYKNNYSVTPGNSYTVVVGAGAPATTGHQANGNGGGDSYFVSGATVKGEGGARGSGGNGGNGGGYTGDGGGNGGNGGGYSGNGSGGGGGAGGYSGNGGLGGSQNGFTPYPTAGSGGAGGGGGASGGGGGGVGLLGEGTSGSAGQTNGSSANTGGSGGTDGDDGDTNRGEAGGTYGGGSGGGYSAGDVEKAGGGAVRILYMKSGTPSRSYPSTNTGDL